MGITGVSIWLEEVSNLLIFTKNPDPARTEQPSLKAQAVKLPGIGVQVGVFKDYTSQQSCRARLTSAGVTEFRFRVKYLGSRLLFG